MKTIRLFLLVLFPFGVLSGCGEPNPPWKFKPSFYYWKTSINLDEKTDQYLDSVKVDRLYVRVFDVTWDVRHRAVVPNGPLDVKTGNRWAGEVVPVVFVTRDALKNLKPAQSKKLAKDILKLTRYLCGRLKRDKVPELQMDCDWTPALKETYFGLLNALRAQMPQLLPGARLSCTIRLSQVKYRNLTGVPPVDRGVLMVYHTAFPGKLTSQDTILDQKDAKVYLGSLSNYPLPLDIALPVFSWAVLFRHDRAPLGILNDVGLEDLKKNADFTEKSHNVYVPLKDTYLRGRLIQKDQWVKVDEPEMNEVEKIVRYLKPRLKNTDPRLILFHLDNSMIGRVTHGRPERLLEIFGI